MDIVTTIISLISGAVGGNIAGAAMSQKNLGPIVNTVTGLKNFLVRYSLENWFLKMENIETLD
jgi:uncharacterized membrane protein YeaQ/YmgE (transglycosylase-associated protein family)